MIRDRYIFSRWFPYFEDPVEGEKYVYFPLHLIPESTTLIKSPFYPNEIAVIEAVSKALPLGWKLYVKEHGAMLGERPICFYKKISELTNIRLMRLDYYDDPKPWITNSVGVITLRGSSAFEAAMLSKPSLILGNTLFELIDGVDKVVSFSELPEKIRAMEKYELDNTQSCAAYLQTVMSFGKYIPLAEILTETRHSIENSTKLAVEIEHLIENLVWVLLADYSDV